MIALRLGILDHPSLYSIDQRGMDFPVRSTFEQSQAPAWS